jgi:hypothetical protein
MRFTKFLAIALFSVVLGASQAHAQQVTGYQVRDCSIASLSGSSQQILAANPQRKFLFIVNNGAGSNSVGLNLAGGTAAINGSGTITLAANGSFLIQANVPQIYNAITVIGTAAQSVQCFEGR